MGQTTGRSPRAAVASGAHGLSFRELTNSNEDLKLLRQFYDVVYKPAFPQPDEQESASRLEGYLALKARQGYGPNNYHILIALHRGRPVAGVIMDYLAEANAGVLEFIVTVSGWRRQKLGTRMLKWAERVASDDARRNGRHDLDLMLAELEDPFKIALPGAPPDAFDRLEIWGRWGFRKLDFPYVQPALTRRQRPVTHLLLSAKAFRRELEERVPARLVERGVHEYIRWAMMPIRPARCLEYRQMSRYLERRRFVPMVLLSRYIGRAPRPSLLVHEVAKSTDPDLRQVAALYRRTFPRGRTSVTPDTFPASLRRAKRTQRYAYHLWALRARRSRTPHGMASFFTLPGGGFGGYIAFDRSLRQTGRLRVLLARIETQMVRDGRRARGWYIECDPHGPQGRIFRRLGFHELAMTHRQPPLPGHRRYGVGEAPILRLMYKEFGRTHEAPRVTQEELRSALASIYRVVYRIPRPAGNPFFRDAEAQIARLMPKGKVTWR